MSFVPVYIAEELRRPYPLTAEQTRYYRQNRYIKLKQVLSGETIAYFNEAISARVEKMNKVTAALKDRNTYGKAFLQLMNLWREDEIVRELVFSKRLGEIAADLMDTRGVRLYHDQALFKEPGGGITPWHADQYYWPLETDKTITAWIPLQATPLGMGPLEFSAGSHQVVTGRELAISDESELVIRERLRVTSFPHIIEAFDVGEVSFHSGWIFHRAGANSTGQMRKVMTVIYMDMDMKLKHPGNANQIADWEAWCPGAVVGEVIDTPLNPVLFERRKD